MTTSKTVYRLKISNGKTIIKVHPIKTWFIRLIERAFSCQHKWSDVEPYKPKLGTISLDDSIPQEVNALIPNHYCRKCKMALVRIERLGDSN